MFQIRTQPSWLPLTILEPSGENCTAVTRESFTEAVVMSSSVVAFRSVMFPPPITSVSPSGENEMQSMHPMRPGSSVPRSSSG